MEVAATFTVIGANNVLRFIR